MSFSNGHRLSSVEENNHLGFMWKKLVRGYREFVADDPGVRFLNTYKRWNQSNASPVAGIAVIGIGVALILVGVLLALVPGVPGIVLGVLGLALIATRFRLMALWLDWTEIKCRKIWSKLRHRNAAG